MGLLRWAVLIVLGYLLYRLLRPRRTREEVPGRSPAASREDVLVKDPWCETFVPREQALEARVEGETLYFCSKECRDHYVTGARGGQE